MIKSDSTLKIRNFKTNESYSYPVPGRYRKKRNTDLNEMLIQDFAKDVSEGLSQSPKRLHSKYLYDSKGSKLFQKIMALSEYYLTRAEYQILETHSKEMISMVNDKRNGNYKMNLIELGAGDGYKASILLKEICDRKIHFEYNPIDISETAMLNLMKRLKNSSLNIDSEGLVSDYFEGIKWLKKNKGSFNFVLFLGSNIGNLDRELAKNFLMQLKCILNKGDCILIGFDLKKEINILQRAYNDIQGVTRDFNLNILRRMNRELKANFNLNHFYHHAFYNPVSGSMESFLISKKEQEVFIDSFKKGFSFQVSEPIHVEYSFKYSIDDIYQIAKTSGFKILGNFYDNKKHFIDTLWRVEN